MTRRLVACLAAAFVVGGAYFSYGPPRITLLNASVVVDYPWPRGAAALACALGVALLAAVMRRPALRYTGLALALGPLAVGTHLLCFRLEAGAAALASRGILGTTAIAWRDVHGVELASASVLVRAGSGDSIRIDTTDFEAEQKAMLERSVARRVREAGGSGVATVPR